jgi:hypothetical protein
VPSGRVKVEEPLVEGAGGVVVVGVVDGVVGVDDGLVAAVVGVVVAG